MKGPNKQMKTKNITERLSQKGESLRGTDWFSLLFNRGMKLSKIIKTFVQQLHLLSTKFTTPLYKSEFFIELSPGVGSKGSSKFWLDTRS